MSELQGPIQIPRQHDSFRFSVMVKEKKRSILEVTSWEFRNSAEKT